LDADALARAGRPAAGGAGLAALPHLLRGYRDAPGEFVRVARGEVPSPCTARDGLAALEIAVAATRALREHRPVQVAEVR
jgi:myo-inositol 2-dehydrogenase/D-chiro-inositol 1-dehydrogenase